MKNHSLLSIAVAAGLLALSAVAAAQYQSPELLFAYDVGDGTNAHPAKIDRYDPGTGQYLGSFGQGTLNFAGEVGGGGITVNDRDLYVTNPVVNGGSFDTLVSEYDFSTGRFLNGWDVPNFTGFGRLAISNGYAYIPSPASDTVATLNLATGASFTQSVPAMNFVNDDYALPGGLAFAGQSSLYGSPGTTALTYTADANGNLSFSSLPGQFGLGYATTDGSSAFDLAVTQVNGADHLVFDSGGGPHNSLFDLNLLSVNLTGPSQAAGQNYIGCLAAGHDGSIYQLNAAQGSFGADSIYYYNVNLPFQYQGLGPDFAIPETYLGEGIAMYAAPEPASLLALGLGALGLMLRKKRKTA